MEDTRGRESGMDSGPGQDAPPRPEFRHVMPRFGRIPYGAAELKRAYNRHMSYALGVSVASTLLLLTSLRFLVDQESFNLQPESVVRLVKYSEIELPRPLIPVESGLSAYPVIEQPKVFQNDSRVEPASALPASSASEISKGRIPKQRTLAGGLNTLPGGTVGIDKLSPDDRSSVPNDMGNPLTPDNHSGIAGGGGPSRDPLRRGGTPVAGKTGEPPSGVDHSGVGSSSKPTAGNTPYAYGGGEEEGEGGGGFSLRWLKGLTRPKISGDLPKYPQGTTVSAQVKILAVVQPGGFVSSVQPVQKANRLLEDAAMKAVRTWQFEPLASTLPQVDQSCVITFVFKLK